MLENLKQEVYNANMALSRYGLVIFTWGNVSGIDREKGLFVIKPSGVAYDQLTPEDMVVMDLEGNRVEGGFNPSSDTPTHMELYNRFPTIGGITHTHSRWATVWAQGARGIPAYGTTHGDYFYGTVPVTRAMYEEEIRTDYELNTGRVIAETFIKGGIDPDDVPAVLVRSHGPFTWGKNAEESVQGAVVLEEVAMMAWHSERLCGELTEMPKSLLDKHFLRKHGKDAYYGQG